MSSKSEIVQRADELKKEIQTMKEIMYDIEKSGSTDTIEQIEYRTALKICDQDLEIAVLEERVRKLLNRERPLGKLKIGCRVIRQDGDGKPAKGRIVSRDRSGKFWLVNRDGYKKTISSTDEMLTNLSVNVYGIIERLKWLAEQELLELKNQLNKYVISNTQISTTLRDPKFQLWYSANELRLVCPLVSLPTAPKTYQKLVVRLFHELVLGEAVGMGETPHLP